MTGAGFVTAVGVATTPVVANGTIRAVNWSGGYSSGGAGNMFVEVALNNTANGNATTATQAPSEQLVSRVGLQYPAGGSANANTQFQLNIPVRQGNQLCLNQITTGTAPTGGIIGADVLVEEGR